MSFILDALKKSETERQRASTAEFAGVPTSGPDSGVPRWLWVVGVLLIINLAVLIGLFLRPDAPAIPAARPAPSTTLPAASPEFEAQVAEARRNPPAKQAPAAVVGPADTPAPAPAAEPVSPSAPRRTTATDTTTLPTIFEVRAEGQVAIPDLHVDIHVYSERPEDRFVFINMTRHREGSRLAEGPVVEEITADGVVLSYQGRTFLLPRE